MKKVTVRKAQQKITSKALGMPIATFIIDVLCLRDRFSAVTIKKGKNSKFSTAILSQFFVNAYFMRVYRIGQKSGRSP